MHTLDPYGALHEHYMHYICPPVLPLTYISFLSPADVVQAEVLDTQALLCLVKTPQPLALYRPPLALPALATPKVPWWSKRKKERESRDKARGKATVAQEFCD